MKQLCDISFSIFQNFHSSENGGVFSIHQRTVQIECCYFMDNSTPQNGGSCYINEGSSKLSKVSFVRSYSTANSENCIQACQCGISRGLSTDTAVKFLYSPSISIIQYNSSKNYGNNGGSGFNIHYPQLEPIVKFLSVETAYDYRFIEFGDANCNLERCNFINSTEVNDVVIYIHRNNQVTLNYCVLYDLKSTKIFYSTYTSIFYDCQSDQLYSFSGITQTQDVQIIDIQMEYKCVANECQKTDIYHIIINIKIIFSNFIYMILYE